MKNDTFVIYLNIPYYYINMNNINHYPVYCEILINTNLFINDISNIIIEYLLPVFDIRRKVLDKLWAIKRHIILGDVCDEIKNYIDKSYGAIDSYFTQYDVYMFLDDNSGRFIYFNIIPFCVFFSPSFNNGDFETKYPIWYEFKSTAFESNLNENNKNALKFKLHVDKIVPSHNYCTITTDCAILKIDYDTLFPVKDRSMATTKDDFTYNKIKPINVMIYT